MGQIYTKIWEDLVPTKLINWVLIVQMDECYRTLIIIESYLLVCIILVVYVLISV